MALAWLGWGSQALVSVQLTGTEGRKTKMFDTGESGALTCLVYHDGEDIKGSCELQPSGRVEHSGVRADLVGVLEQYHDRGAPREFTKSTQVLSGAGVLDDVTTLHFAFSGARLPHETFYGVNVRVRYYVRVIVAAKGGTGVLADKSVEFAVEQAGVRPARDTKIRMEVGIEEFLHIEFEYDRETYALTDTLTGRVHFRLVQLQLKHMELTIIRREKTKTRGVAYSESDTLCKYEVMDGVPARGTVVPLRLFLEAYELTPTYRKVEGIFSVEYFVNLVLIDQQDRRYFKQHEIVLFREGKAGPRVRPAKAAKSAVAPAVPAVSASAPAPALAPSGAGAEASASAANPFGAEDDDGL